MSTAIQVRFDGASDRFHRSITRDLTVGRVYTALRVPKGALLVSARTNEDGFVLIDDVGDLVQCGFSGGFTTVG